MPACVVIKKQKNKTQMNACFIIFEIVCKVYWSNNLSLQNSPLLQGRVFGGGQRYRLESLPGTLSMASLNVMSAREDFSWLRHRKTAETEKDAEGGSLKTVFSTLLLQFSIPDTLSS